MLYISASGWESKNEREESPSKLYIPCTIKTEMNPVPLLLLGKNWVVKPLLKSSAILLMWHTFEVGFSYFHGQNMSTPFI